VDALYSTVQMPSGVPVATVGMTGKNAAYLACEILSIKISRDRKEVGGFKGEDKKVSGREIEGVERQEIEIKRTYPRFCHSGGNRNPVIQMVPGFRRTRSGLRLSPE